MFYLFLKQLKIKLKLLLIYPEWANEIVFVAVPFATFQYFIPPFPSPETKTPFGRTANVFMYIEFPVNTLIVTPVSIFHMRIVLS